MLDAPKLLWHGINRIKKAFPGGEGIFTGVSILLRVTKRMPLPLLLYTARLRLPKGMAATKTPATIRAHQTRVRGPQPMVVAAVAKAKPGISDDEAYALAAKEVAIPGTSEHQLGLAVDIVCCVEHYNLDAQKTKVRQQWLIDNCHKYGFILRFPADKTDVTGIIYEPWHYRYVGVEVATEIMSRGICFEEWLAEQKAQ